MTGRHLVVVLGLASVGACEREASEQGAAPPSPAPEWVVTSTGIGPLRLGAELQALRPHLQPLADSAAVAQGCGYARPAAGPDSVLLMIASGRLARVDVIGGETSTAEGARVGDSEARIEELYPRARREPHKYVDGSYLVAIPGAPADTVRRIVFETDGARVTRYRAGLYPQVEWVEGCS